jgi:ArsR family transcriptional regulator
MIAGEKRREPLRMREDRPRAARRSPLVSETLPAIDTELAALAKAIGHPVRVRILELLLARDSCSCGEVVDELPLAQATVSQHLKVLKDAGLIRGEIEGPRVCYCADVDGLRRLGDLVSQLVGSAGPGPERCEA